MRILITDIGNPSKLTDLTPLPFGYEITAQTDTELLWRGYILNGPHINPKIVVSKRIEESTFNATKYTSPQTTTHITLIYTVVR